jgi:nitrogen fixation protein FixH
MYRHKDTIIFIVIVIGFNTIIMVQFVMYWNAKPE